jgi:hypothetical protein
MMVRYFVISVGDVAACHAFVLLGHRDHKVSISECEIPLVPRKINIHVCHPEVLSFIYQY